MTSKFITERIQMIREMIHAIENDEEIIRRVGGFDIAFKSDEIKFQRARLSELEFIEANDIEEIEQRISEMKRLLTSEELLKIQGDVSGMSLDKILIIAQIELLQMSISEVD